MIRNASLFAIALSCCATASATDVRIKTLPYDPHQIVRVSGHTGIQSTIEFAPDERIENIAVGDSAAWQVTPNRRASLIFLKPLVATSRSNMTVVTDRRTYMFDLVTSPRGAPPIYALRFSYPAGEIRSAAQLRQPDAPAVAPVVVVAPAPVRPDQFNFAWTSKGAAALLPKRAFDDGTSLYLAWNRDVPLPAIMTMADDHKEATLNYRVDGEYIVVSPIPSNIMLRYANKQASVWPSAPARAVRSQRTAAPQMVQASTIAPKIVVPQPAATLLPAPQTVPVAVAPAPNRAPVVEPQQIAAAAIGKLRYPNAIFNDHLTDADHDK